MTHRKLHHIFWQSLSDSRRQQQSPRQPETHTIKEAASPPRTNTAYAADKCKSAQI